MHKKVIWWKKIAATKMFQQTLFPSDQNGLHASKKKSPLKEAKDLRRFLLYSIAEPTILFEFGIEHFWTSPTNWCWSSVATTTAGTKYVICTTTSWQKLPYFSQIFRTLAEILPFQVAVSSSSFRFGRTDLLSPTFECPSECDIFEATHRLLKMFLSAT